MMDDDALIAAAASVLKLHFVKDRLFGDVAAAVQSAGGHIYTGVCVDTRAGDFVLNEAPSLP